MGPGSMAGTPGPGPFAAAACGFGSFGGYGGQHYPGLESTSPTLFLWYWGLNWLLPSLNTDSSKHNRKRPMKKLRKSMGLPAAARTLLDLSTAVQPRQR
jgi:hypothetical protein